MSQPNFRVTRANHVGINVASLPRAISFYHDLLDLPIAFRFDHTQQSELEIAAWSKICNTENIRIKAAMVTLPNEVMIELVEFVNPVSGADSSKTAQLQNHGTMHFSFEVDNLDALVVAVQGWKGGDDDDVHGKGRGKLELMGKEKVPKGAMAGWTVAFFRGADGELLEIFQKPDAA